MFEPNEDILPQRLENYSKKFYSEDVLPRNGVHWSVTWNIGTVSDEMLFKLIDAAMPYEVFINTKMFGNYTSIYKWIENNNLDGLWTHCHTCFQFQNEEDAVAFKLRWC